MRLFILLGLATVAHSFFTTDIDDDHDHDHDHSHTGDTPDCECITGITTEMLDIACNDSETLTEIQHYLVENDCIDWCELHNGTQEWNANYWMELEDDTDSDTDTDHDHDHNAEGEEPGWICFQAFSLLNQYHDYCPSGAINETLFHIFLDVCPDCIGDTHYDEGAANCSTNLNCTDGDAQLAAITYVSDNCMDTCEGNCTEVWQTVEGYHQICDHDDLSEEFDTIFDNLAYEETACGEDVHCNVVGAADYEANCSSNDNAYFYEHLLEYGNLDVEHDILDDHDDHDHDDDHPDCECITGYTTDDLDIACNDTETLNEIQNYLVENDCISYCHTHDDHNELHLSHGSSEEEGWICFQAFSLVNQYHDYCPSGAINETLFHLYLDECPDCSGATHYEEGAANCSTSLNCSDGDAQLTAIQYVVDYCILTCDGNCTDVWQTVEGYHQICDHDDLSEEFDSIFDSLAFTVTACGDDIHCNVVGADEEANCSSHENEWYYEYLLEYGELDLEGDILDVDGAIRLASGFGVIIASLYNMLLQ